MNKLLYLLALSILSCTRANESQHAQEDSTSMVEPVDLEPAVEIKKAAETKTAVCWTGTLNGKIPVFMQYSIEGRIVIGAITYLNTKDQTPIKIIGTVEDDNSYRLLEFDAAGNITGIITGVPTNNQFTGSWFSPKSRKELRVALTLKDTLIAVPELHADPSKVFGRYHYQYSAHGYQGDIELTQLADKRAAFRIFWVTSAPARNMADIPTDTIPFDGHAFTYHVEDADDCAFDVQFFKDFVYIHYTQGACIGQFGHNATVEGIYLKTE